MACTSPARLSAPGRVMMSPRTREYQRGILDERGVGVHAVGGQRDDRAAVACEGCTVRGVLRQYQVDIGHAQINGGQTVGEVAGWRADDRLREA